MKKLVSYGSITFALAMLFAMTASAAGPAPVVLGTAGNFVILSESGITTTGTTAIVGDIGVSPIDSTAITGFGLVLDGSGTFATSSLVTGKVYAANYGVPTPAYLGTAVSDMKTAYTNALGRAPGVGPKLNLGGGTVAGVTLAPGTYTWTGNLDITGDITLKGGANDVWIFQVAGTLDMAANKSIILAGAQANNVFWQVAGVVTLFPGSHFEGTILAFTKIAMQDGATLDGRALAQTAVTLIANTVAIPDLTTSNPKAPNFDSQLNDKACGEHLVKVIDVTEKVINDADSGQAGNTWAFDATTRHIKVWLVSAGTPSTYCATVVYDGTAFAIQGAIGPGGSGLIGHDVKAKIKGGYRATIIGTLLTTPVALWPTHGNVGGGTVDYECSILADCPGYINWIDQYFVPGYSYTQDWWGWFYDAGNHGKWLNSIGGNSGNIN
jgi:Ice-binding-like